MTPARIDCTLHDYLEMACMFHYDVRVTLDDQSVVTGQAVTTSTESDKSEVLRLAGIHGPIAIRMDAIAYLEVLTENARFRSVDFNESTVAVW